MAADEHRREKGCRDEGLTMGFGELFCGFCTFLKHSVESCRRDFSCHASLSVFKVLGIPSIVKELCIYRI